MEVVVERPEMILIEKIKKTREKDEEVVKVVKEMKKSGVKTLRGNEWKIERELVLKKEKMYMPRDEKLILELMILELIHHDVPAARHGGK